MSTLTNAQRPGAAAIWLFDEGKGDMATDSSQHKHTAKVEGKVKWDQSKIGQAGQFQPDNYFVVDHTKTLNLSTFTITVWVKFFEGTGGREQNIVHKQEGKDRSTRNYTIKIWEGTPFSFLPARAIRCPQVAWYLQDNWWQLASPGWKLR